MKNSEEKGSLNTFIKLLESRLKESLPGPDAWRRMMPEGRLLEMPPDTIPVQSAVLVLFIEKEERLYLLLIRRSEDGKIHGGQIGFPGGRSEPTDTDLWFTALREAQEETGITLASIERLGQLSPLYIPHSNFIVHPFVGFTAHPQLFRRQKEEIDEILLIPYSCFFNPNCLTNSVFETLRGPVTAPCFTIADIRIWGATAMIISELLSISPAIFHSDPLNRELIRII